MKPIAPRLRNSLFLAAIITALIVAITFFQGLPETGAAGTGTRTDGDKAGAADGIPPRVGAGERREREFSGSFSSANGKSSYRLIMDRIVTRGAEGEKIVALNPPATAGTLRTRLDAQGAELKVFPLALEENVADPEGALRMVTSKIRVKMDREKAQEFARRHDVVVSSMPSYAPGWVVFSASAPMDALAKIDRLRADPDAAVADVLLGRRAVTMALPNDPLVKDQWHLKASGQALDKDLVALPNSDLNVEGAWGYPGNGGVRGRGVYIGVIDDGVQTSHPDLIANIDTTIDYDFVDYDADPNPDLSANLGEGDGHGTAVAGVAAARGNNGIGVTGVAPEAKIVGERLITGGFITDEQVADAISHRNDVIDIKNNSWGFVSFGLVDAEELSDLALEDAAKNGRSGRGTILTFAAGNSAEDLVNANYQFLTSSIYTIAVGATDSRLRRSYYSQPGANLGISAPSNGIGIDALGITTTDLVGASGYNDEGNYTNEFGGTSSACPAVSGAIALMLEKNPNLGWRDVQEILIQSASKINPTDPDWITNDAGFHFNHDFGPGLLDATAAVELAGTWKNLGPQVTATSFSGIVNEPIRDDIGATGARVVFKIPTSNIRTEQVTVKLRATHSSRANLLVSLFSPSGTESRLAEISYDFSSDINDYRFSTVRSWGENSSGLWTLVVTDKSRLINAGGGMVNSAELTVYGTSAEPTDPDPIVRITSPDNGAVFSPGSDYTIEVEASDFDINGARTTVSSVELYQDGIPIGTDNAAPYSFQVSPPEGVRTYVAYARNSSGQAGESLPIRVTVMNQSPVIRFAKLSAGPTAYDDTPISVVSVDVSDPEADPVSLTYQWQFSTDAKVYEDSPVTQATLPPSPSNSGKLWRSVVTASDGNTTGNSYTTESVNILKRPPVRTFAPGSSYSYWSGLILSSKELVVDRPAIIHEFSQGPPGATSEWIEILTLRRGSLEGWSLDDASRRGFTFSSGGQWADVPAGTLIVIFNGTAPKDPALPPTGVNSALKSMVVASTDSVLFAPGSVWPLLENTGDSLFLNGPIIPGNQPPPIHQISYGNSGEAKPNIGIVSNGRAAYYVGKDVVGAVDRDFWVVTSAAGRKSAPSGVAPLSISPGAFFQNGRYIQDFDAAPGASGTRFPTGWSAYSVDFGRTETTNVDRLAIPQNNSAIGDVYNFGSKIGILGGNIRFDPGFIALALDNTRGETGLKIGFDLVKVSEQPRSTLIKLEYALATPGNTNTTWRAVSNVSYTSGSLPNGTVTKFRNVALPSVFANRETPIYLRWYYQTSNSGQTSGARDSVAIDNVVISSDRAPNVYLTLSLDPAIIAENAGANASTGKITLNEVLANDLVVNITSSDLSEATVPPSVTIPAGKLSASFPINAIDDNIPEGTQSVIISVTSSGAFGTVAVLQVMDTDVALPGVTPGLPNGVENGKFIQRLREGSLIESAVFRIVGVPLPEGLSLNPQTGVVSGIIGAGVKPGTYPVTIEARNEAGETQSFVFSIKVGLNAGLSFKDWISQYNLADATPNGDPDFDSIPNILEFIMQSAPGVNEQPPPIRVASEDGRIVLHYRESKTIDADPLIAEWSGTMMPGTWSSQGIKYEKTSESAEFRNLKASLPVLTLEGKRFMRLKSTMVPPSAP